MLAFVKALYDAGIPIIAGTDCTAGFCLHRELELYSEAGIPNAEVLRIATWGAATVTKRADRLGAVRAGYFADLILVDGDPVADISNIRRVEGGPLALPPRAAPETPSTASPAASRWSSARVLG